MADDSVVSLSPVTAIRTAADNGEGMACVDFTDGGVDDGGTSGGRGNRVHPAPPAPRAVVAAGASCTKYRTGSDGSFVVPPHLHGHHLAALQADVAAIKQAVERLTTAIAPK